MLKTLAVIHLKNVAPSSMVVHTVIPSLGKLRQEGLVFEASLGSIVQSYLKNKF